MNTLPALYVLLAFMMIGSIIAVETRDLLSSIVSIGAVGFCLSLIYLILGAPDLAITQVVVEILILVILLRATITRDDTTVEEHRDMFAIAMGLLFAGVLIAVCVWAFRGMVPYGQPVMAFSKDYVRTGLEKTGAPNQVAAVILDFRGYDTLGEATVIFTGIIGTYVVVRRIGRRRRAGHDAHR